MNISLSPQLELIVKNKVKSGLYASSSEVIREALRYMEQIEEAKKDAFLYLQKKIKIPMSSPYTKEEIQIISNSFPHSNFNTEEDIELDSPTFINKAHKISREELWKNVGK